MNLAIAFAEILDEFGIAEKASRFIRTKYSWTKLQYLDAEYNLR